MTIALKEIHISNEKKRDANVRFVSLIKENDLSEFDLILLDPPFNQNYEKKVLDILDKNESLKSSCKIYIEFSKFTDIEIPDSFTICKEKKLGDVKALLLKNDN